MKAARKIQNLISSPSAIFVVLGSIYGFAFLFITPPFQAPDEIQHFYRAFSISEGNFIAIKKENTVGRILPVSLVTTVTAVMKDIHFHPENKQTIADILAIVNLPLEMDNRNFLPFPNAALYPPIPYLPQSLGIHIGKVFNYCLWALY